MCSVINCLYAVTFPLDLVKTRLQIQGEGGKPQPHRGFLATSFGVIRDEGPLKLWRGLTPAIYRHVLYSGIRLSVYERLRERGLGRNPDGSFPLWSALYSLLSLFSFIACFLCFFLSSCHLWFPSSFSQYFLSPPQH